MKTLAARLGFFLFSIVAALALTFVLMAVVLHPPLNDLLFLSIPLTVTSLGSAAIGFVSYRLGWWRRRLNLSQTLILGYVIAAGLTLFNVWLTARLMFISDHDLALGSLLLLFAGGISVAFGTFLSSSVTESLQDLTRAAERLSEGDFSTRVPVTGSDEIAQLAHVFNVMVARLEQAREAERGLEVARRNLVAWASHDLRTPLASMRAMLDALTEGVVTDAETVNRYLRQSQNEVRRMSTLIDDLFELAQLDAGYLELHGEFSSLSDLISDSIEAFSARAKAVGVKLAGSVTPDVDPVWMAPEKIERALHNLLENALRHTPSGGEVEVRAERQDDLAIVSVADSGEGIPPKDLPHVFDPFYRGEKSRKRDEPRGGGAGLGLSIAKGLVESHGGRMWAESAPGHGTRMWFSLPRSSPAMAEPG